MRFRCVFSSSSSSPVGGSQASAIVSVSLHSPEQDRAFDGERRRQHDGAAKSTSGHGVSRRLTRYADERVCPGLCPDGSHPPRGRRPGRAHHPVEFAVCVEQVVPPAAQVGDHHSSVRHDRHGRGVAKLTRTLARPAQFPNEAAIGTYQEHPLGLDLAVEYQQVASRVEGHALDMPELLPLLAGKRAEPVEFLELDFQRAVLGGKLDDLLAGCGACWEQARGRRRAQQGALVNSWSCSCDLRPVVSVMHPTDPVTKVCNLPDRGK